MTNTFTEETIKEFDSLYGVYLARVDQTYLGMSIDESAKKFLTTALQEAYKKGFIDGGIS